MTKIFDTIRKTRNARRRGYQNASKSTSVLVHETWSCGPRRSIETSDRLFSFDKVAFRPVDADPSAVELLQRAVVVLEVQILVL